MRLPDDATVIEDSALKVLRLDLASEQVKDCALASVPESPEGGTEIHGHWHLNQAKWEHGGNNACTC